MRKGSNLKRGEGNNVSRGGVRMGKLRHCEERIKARRGKLKR